MKIERPKSDNYLLSVAALSATQRCVLEALVRSSYSSSEFYEALCGFVAWPWERGDLFCWAPLLNIFDDYYMILVLKLGLGNDACRSRCLAQLRSSLVLAKKVDTVEWILEERQAQSPAQSAERSASMDYESYSPSAKALVALDKLPEADFKSLICSVEVPFLLIERMLLITFWILEGCSSRSLYASQELLAALTDAPYTTIVVAALQCITLFHSTTNRGRSRKAAELNEVLFHLPLLASNPIPLLCNDIELNTSDGPLVQNREFDDGYQEKEGRGLSRGAAVNGGDSPGPETEQPRRFSGFINLYTGRLPLGEVLKRSVTTLVLQVNGDTQSSSLVPVEISFAEILGGHSVQDIQYMSELQLCDLQHQAFRKLTFKYFPDIASQREIDSSADAEFASSRAVASECIHQDNAQSLAIQMQHLRHVVRVVWNGVHPLGRVRLVELRISALAALLSTNPQAFTNIVMTDQFLLPDLALTLSQHRFISDRSTKSMLLELWTGIVQEKIQSKVVSQLLGLQSPHGLFFTFFRECLTASPESKMEIPVLLERETEVKATDIDTGFWLGSRFEGALEGGLESNPSGKRNFMITRTLETDPSIESSDNLLGLVENAMETTSAIFVRTDLSTKNRPWCSTCGCATDNNTYFEQCKCTYHNSKHERLFLLSDGGRLMENAMELYLAVLTSSAQVPPASTHASVIEAILGFVNVLTPRCLTAVMGIGRVLEHILDYCPNGMQVLTTGKAVDRLVARLKYEVAQLAMLPSFDAEAQLRTFLEPVPGSGDAFWNNVSFINTSVPIKACVSMAEQQLLQINKRTSDAVELLKNLHLPEKRSEVVGFIRLLEQIAHRRCLARVLLKELSSLLRPVDTNNMPRALVDVFGMGCDIAVQAIFQYPQHFGLGAYGSSVALLAQFIGEDPATQPALIQRGIVPDFLRSISPQVLQVEEVFQVAPACLANILLHRSGLWAMRAIDFGPLKFCVRGVVGRVVVGLDRAGEVSATVGTRLDELVREGGVPFEVVADAAVETANELLQFSRTLPLWTPVSPKEASDMATVFRKQSSQATMRDLGMVPPHSDFLADRLANFSRFLQCLVSAHSKFLQRFITGGGFEAILDLVASPSLPPSFLRVLPHHPVGPLLRKLSSPPTGEAVEVVEKAITQRLFRAARTLNSNVGLLRKVVLSRSSSQLKSAQIGGDFIEVAEAANAICILDVALTALLGGFREANALVALRGDTHSAFNRLMANAVPVCGPLLSKILPMLIARVELRLAETPVVLPTHHPAHEHPSVRASRVSLAPDLQLVQPTNFFWTSLCNFAYSIESPLFQEIDPENPKWLFSSENLITTSHRKISPTVLLEMLRVFCCQARSVLTAASRAANSVANRRGRLLQGSQVTEEQVLTVARLALNSHASLQQIPRIPLPTDLGVDPFGAIGNGIQSSWLQSPSIEELSQKEDLLIQWGFLEKDPISESKSDLCYAVPGMDMIQTARFSAEMMDVLYRTQVDDKSNGTAGAATMDAFLKFGGLNLVLRCLHYSFGVLIALIVLHEVYVKFPESAGLVKAGNLEIIRPEAISCLLYVDNPAFIQWIQVAVTKLAKQPCSSIKDVEVAIALVSKCVHCCLSYGEKVTSWKRLYNGPMAGALQKTCGLPVRPQSMEVEDQSLAGPSAELSGEPAGATDELSAPSPPLAIEQTDETNDRDLTEYHNNNDVTMTNGNDEFKRFIANFFPRCLPPFMVGAKEEFDCKQLVRTLQCEFVRHLLVWCRGLLPGCDPLSSSPSDLLVALLPPKALHCFIKILFHFMDSESPSRRRHAETWCADCSPSPAEYFSNQNRQRCLPMIRAYLGLMIRQFTSHCGFVLPIEFEIAESGFAESAEPHPAVPMAIDAVMETPSINDETAVAITSNTAAMNNTNRVLEEDNIMPPVSAMDAVSQALQAVSEAQSTTAATIAALHSASSAVSAAMAAMSRVTETISLNEAFATQIKKRYAFTATATVDQAVMTAGKYLPPVYFWSQADTEVGISLIQQKILGLLLNLGRHHNAVTYVPIVGESLFKFLPLCSSHPGFIPVGPQLHEFHLKREQALSRAALFFMNGLQLKFNVPPHGNQSSYRLVRSVDPRILYRYSHALEDPNAATSYGGASSEKFPIDANTAPADGTPKSDSSSPGEDSNLSTQKRNLGALAEALFVRLQATLDFLERGLSHAERLIVLLMPPPMFSSDDVAQILANEHDALRGIPSGEQPFTMCGDEIEGEKAPNVRELYAVVTKDAIVASYYRSIATRLHNSLFAHFFLFINLVHRWDRSGRASAFSQGNAFVFLLRFPAMFVAARKEAAKIFTAEELHWFSTQVTPSLRPSDTSQNDNMRPFCQASQLNFLTTVDVPLGDYDVQIPTWCLNPCRPYCAKNEIALESLKQVYAQTLWKFGRDEQNVTKILTDLDRVADIPAVARPPAWFACCFLTYSQMLCLIELASPDDEETVTEQCGAVDIDISFNPFSSTSSINTNLPGSSDKPLAPFMSVKLQKVLLEITLDVVQYYPGLDGVLAAAIFHFLVPLTTAKHNISVLLNERQLQSFPPTTNASSGDEKMLEKNSNSPLFNSGLSALLRLPRTGMFEGYLRSLASLIMNLTVTDESLEIRMRQDFTKAFYNNAEAGTIVEGVPSGGKAATFDRSIPQPSDEMRSIDHVGTGSPTAIATDEITGEEDEKDADDNRSGASSKKGSVGLETPPNLERTALNQQFMGVFPRSSASQIEQKGIEDGKPNTPHVVSTQFARLSLVLKAVYPYLRRSPRIFKKLFGSFFVVYTVHNGVYVETPLTRDEELLGMTQGGPKYFLRLRPNAAETVVFDTNARLAAVKGAFTALRTLLAHLEVLLSIAAKTRMTPALGKFLPQTDAPTSIIQRTNIVAPKMPFFASNNAPMYPFALLPDSILYLVNHLVSNVPEFAHAFTLYKTNDGSLAVAQKIPLVPFRWPSAENAGRVWSYSSKETLLSYLTTTILPKSLDFSEEEWLEGLPNRPPGFILEDISQPSANVPNHIAQQISRDLCTTAPLIQHALVKAAICMLVDLDVRGDVGPFSSAEEALLSERLKSAISYPPVAAYQELVASCKGLPTVPTRYTVRGIHTSALLLLTTLQTPFNYNRHVTVFRALYAVRSAQLWKRPVKDLFEAAYDAAVEAFMMNSPGNLEGNSHADKHAQLKQLFKSQEQVSALGVDDLLIARAALGRILASFPMDSPDCQTIRRLIVKCLEFLSRDPLLLVLALGVSYVDIIKGLERSETVPAANKNGESGFPVKPTLNNGELETNFSTNSPVYDDDNTDPPFVEVARAVPPVKRQNIATVRRHHSAHTMSDDDGESHSSSSADDESDNTDSSSSGTSSDVEMDGSQSALARVADGSNVIIADDDDEDDEIIENPEDDDEDDEDDDEDESVIGETCICGEVHGSDDASSESETEVPLPHEASEDQDEDIHFRNRSGVLSPDEEDMMFQEDDEDDEPRIRDADDAETSWRAGRGSHGSRDDHDVEVRSDDFVLLVGNEETHSGVPSVTAEDTFDLIATEFEGISDSLGRLARSGRAVRRPTEDLNEDENDDMDGDDYDGDYDDEDDGEDDGEDEDDEPEDDGVEDGDEPSGLLDGNDSVHTDVLRGNDSQENTHSNDQTTVLIGEPSGEIDGSNVEHPDNLNTAAPVTTATATPAVTSGVAPGVAPGIGPSITSAGTTATNDNVAPSNMMTEAGESTADIRAAPTDVEMGGERSDEFIPTAHPVPTDTQEVNEASAEAPAAPSLPDVVMTLTDGLCLLRYEMITAPLPTGEYFYDESGPPLRDLALCLGLSQRQLLSVMSIDPEFLAALPPELQCEIIPGQAENISWEAIQSHRRANFEQLDEIRRVVDADYIDILSLRAMRGLRFLDVPAASNHSDNPAGTANDNPHDNAIDTANDDATDIAIDASDANGGNSEVDMAGANPSMNERENGTDNEEMGVHITADAVMRTSEDTSSITATTPAEGQRDASPHGERIPLSQRLVDPASINLPQGFLFFFPSNIRALVREQLAEPESSAVGTAAAVPGPSDMDNASFFATLDPALRRELLLNVREEELPPELIAEASLLRARERGRLRPEPTATTQPRLVARPPRIRPSDMLRAIPPNAIARAAEGDTSSFPQLYNILMTMFGGGAAQGEITVGTIPRSTIESAQLTRRFDVEQPFNIATTEGRTAEVTDLVMSQILGDLVFPLTENGPRNAAGAAVPTTMHRRRHIVPTGSPRNFVRYGLLGDDDILSMMFGGRRGHPVTAPPDERPTVTESSRAGDTNFAASGIRFVTDYQWQPASRRLNSDSKINGIIMLSSCRCLFLRKQISRRDLHRIFLAFAGAHPESRHQFLQLLMVVVWAAAIDVQKECGLPRSSSKLATVLGFPPRRLYTAEPSHRSPVGLAIVDADGQTAAVVAAYRALEHLRSLLEIVTVTPRYFVTAADHPAVFDFGARVPPGRAEEHAHAVEHGEVSTKDCFDVENTPSSSKMKCITPNRKVDNKGAATQAAHHSCAAVASPEMGYDETNLSSRDNRPKRRKHRDDIATSRDRDEFVPRKARMSCNRCRGGVDRDIIASGGGGGGGSGGGGGGGAMTPNDGGSMRRIKSKRETDGANPPVKQQQLNQEFPINVLIELACKSIHYRHSPAHLQHVLAILLLLLSNSEIKVLPILKESAVRALCDLFSGRPKDYSPFGKPAVAMSYYPLQISAAVAPALNKIISILFWTSDHRRVVTKHLKDSLQALTQAVTDRLLHLREMLQSVAHPRHSLDSEKETASTADIEQRLMKYLPDAEFREDLDSVIGAFTRYSIVLQEVHLIGKPADYALFLEPEIIERARATLTRVNAPVTPAASSVAIDPVPAVDMETDPDSATAQSPPDNVAPNNGNLESVPENRPLPAPTEEEPARDVEPAGTLNENSTTVAGDDAVADRALLMEMAAFLRGPELRTLWRLLDNILRILEAACPSLRLPAEGPPSPLESPVESADNVMRRNSADSTEDIHPANTRSLRRDNITTDTTHNPPASRNRTIQNIDPVNEAALKSGTYPPLLINELFPLIETYFALQQIIIADELGMKASEIPKPNKPGSQPDPVQQAFQDQIAEVLLDPESKFTETHSAVVIFCERHRLILNLLIQQAPGLLSTNLQSLIAICPICISFENKRFFFRQKLKLIRAEGRYESIRLNVRRSQVFTDSFHQLRMRTGSEMRGKLLVHFSGEEGVDAGGLTREWYGILAREMFNPDYALFRREGTKAEFNHPNPLSYVNPDHLAFFKFIGRVIGKAIFDGQHLGAYFTRSFYKHMLGRKVTPADAESIDPEFYKSLLMIRHHKINDLGLDLTFSTEVDEFGRTQVVDLIPNGRNIAVTEENKNEYIRVVCNHKINNAVRPQIEAFLSGFHELVPPKLLAIFNDKELELLISGSSFVDISDLRANTTYHGYTPSSQVIQWFWEVLEGFDQNKLTSFLQFATGTSRVPLGGFKELMGMRGPQLFSIHKDYDENRLPSAHTCFNQLDLPEYSAKERLRSKLLLAVSEGREGFGFV